MIKPYLTQFALLFPWFLAGFLRVNKRNTVAVTIVSKKIDSFAWPVSEKGNNDVPSFRLILFSLFKLLTIFLLQKTIHVFCIIIDESWEYFEKRYR